MAKYFGTDGIRGFANKTLTVDTVYKIGRFIGHYYLDHGGKIVVGKDSRLSSDMFESALISGIVASGTNVYLLGYTSTPALAYICKNEQFSVGVMISASHNPYHDNGIKLFANTGIKISEDIESLIENYIDNPSGIPLALDDKIGRIINYHIGVEHYMEFISDLFKGKLNKYRILVDLANGSACFTAKKIYETLGIKADFINDKPNGININDGCGSTHIEKLAEQVKLEGYDFGFAFDGDADRFLAVDNNGDVVDGDRIMFIIAKELLKNKQLNDNTLVVTVMSNYGLFKALNSVGINSDIVAVGDKNVLDSMMKNNFSLGGEQSGHIINSHYTNFGDGVLTSLMLLAVICKYDLSVDQLSKEFISYPQLLKNVRVADKEVIMKSKELKDIIEGVNLKLNGDGRVLVRPSGTEPLIRVMVEAKTQELCEMYVDEIIEVIK